MRVLFIGGTGTISQSCSELAVARGLDLTLLNRGMRKTGQAEPAPVVCADVRDVAATRAALGTRSFDVVVDFVAYLPEHIEADLALFGGRCRHYIFISSAAAYRKPPISWPIEESCVLHNPFWQYARDKIACEDRLMRAFREDSFPVTIVRPSYTYDRTRLPVFGAWTVVDRMRRGAPVVVHGDGTSLWTLTHAGDFAIGLVGLLGNQQAIGEAVHITGDEVLTWDRIYRLIAAAAGAPEPRLVHAPSEVIARCEPRWAESLLGDKSFSAVFDNRKIRKLVPDFVAKTAYSQGVVETIAWHDADRERRCVDQAADRVFDRLTTAMNDLV
jgi:nucleoside-diphosphate-sugar epimerase